MENDYLKTSWKQRLVAVAVMGVMLIGTLMTYAFLIINKGETQEQKNEKEMAEIQEGIRTRMAAAADKMSDQYFGEFIKYKKAEAFNANTANSKPLQKKDLKEGTGKELTKGDTDYYAYYIGYCADESIFDSSFDDKEKPSKLGAPIRGKGLIAGWTEGVIGMKLGGVREIIMPGELAYGETRSDICGMKNAPLKFIVMAVDGTEYEKSANSK